MTEGASHDAGAVVVSTAWLEARLAEPRIRVVDVRGKVLPPGNKPRYHAKRADYEAARIPGAAFVDWTSDIIDPKGSAPMQVATPEAFAAAMNAVGVGDDTLAVVYDDYDHIFAGRLAWALRYYGHEGVRVLDGGWARWLAEGRPTEAGPPIAAGPPAKPFQSRPVAALRKTADDVERSIGRSDVVLIDARPANQYAGAVSAASRAGHIPGARNVPYASLVDKDSGRFLPAPELARVFLDSGIDVATLPSEIVVYCNGGVSCTVPLNALRILGRDDVAVYDGSWNEWGEDP
ncbi:MAG TPA: sulfurtransferase, partial [Polyangiaceae bacterium]|nr:sulfurtransferase [Polyangiaceae bacterium]